MDPLDKLKRTAALFAVVALLLVVVWFRKGWIGSCGGLLGLLIILVLLLQWFVRVAMADLIAVARQRGEHMRSFSQAYGEALGRENLPRQVFWLLFTVAEADGRSEREERELVRSFLLERFVDPRIATDLQQWEAQRLPPEQLEGLALHIARMLSSSERETVFSWCCLVAFADGSYKQEEHEALQKVARAFRLEGHHARRIFHYAKNLHMHGSAQGQQQGGAGGPGARGSVSSRSEALKVLGLEPDAGAADIKKRHRELVRQFHPDRHQHLGEVAAKEAEARFREVQAAYELLAG